MHLTPLGGRALGSNLNIQLSGDRLDLLPKARAHTLGLRHPRVKSQYSILFLLGLSLPAPDHLRALLESLRSEGQPFFYDHWALSLSRRELAGSRRRHRTEDTVVTEGSGRGRGSEVTGNEGCE